MTQLTPSQQRLQERIEGLIAAAAPFLDLILAVGDRISRAVEPEDFEYYPVRPGPEASPLGRGEPSPPMPAGGDGASRADEADASVEPPAGA